MDTTQMAEIKRDFRDWSGGFSPESGDQITVYLDYAAPRMTDEERANVQQMLLEWVESGDRDSDRRLSRPINHPTPDHAATDKLLRRDLLDNPFLAD